MKLRHWQKKMPNVHPIYPANRWTGFGPRRAAACLDQQPELELVLADDGLGQQVALQAKPENAVCLDHRPELE
jgi:hypothetical protein